MEFLAKAIVTIILLIALYYSITELMYETAEGFGITEGIVETTDGKSEGFCVGPGCGRRKYYRYRRYSDPYYYSYYPYFGYGGYGGYGGYWWNPWGYLPCVDSAGGKTYCW